MQRLCLFLGMLVIAACGSNVEGGGGGGGGGNGGAGGSAETTSASSSSSGSSVQCVGNPSVFPTFDKSCVMITDCVIALHMVNCCGTLTAIGINSAEKSAFDAAESVCQMQYPGCGCAQSPTTTEDGKMSMDDTQIQVDCIGGQCMTFLP